MSAPIGKKVDDALKFGVITLEVAGLFFPPLAMAANDLRAFEDLYAFLEAHAFQSPGLSVLPGPPLQVRNPAKW